MVVSLANQKRVVHPSLNAIIDRGNAEFVPRAERRSLYAYAGDLIPAPIVVVKIKLVLQCVDVNDVIAAIREAKNDAAGRVLAPTYRLEAKRHIDVGVRTTRRDDDIEGIGRGALYQCAAFLYCAGNLRNRPAAAHRFPAFKRPSKVEPDIGRGGCARQFSEHQCPQCRSLKNLAPRRIGHCAPLAKASARLSLSLGNFKLSTAISASISSRRAKGSSLHLRRQ